VRFQVADGFFEGLDAKHGTDSVDAFIRVGPIGEATELQLSKDALLEATSICGIPKGYASRTPGRLIEPQLNYWFRGGLATKQYQVLQAGDVAQAITRGSIVPFSNLRLLEQIEAAIHDTYGAQGNQLYVDYKFEHTLRRTHMRIIVPERVRVLEGTGTDNDTWSTGISLVNSLVGVESTELCGYLFRWWCTNGCTDQHATSGKWSRRGANGSSDEVYDWARAAVDDVLGGLEHSLDAVQALVDVPIEGEAMQALHDVFEQYAIPIGQREAIIQGMVESDQLNMYGLHSALTQAANRDGLPAEQVAALLEVGGDLPHAVSHRCTTCRRILPE
jgi:hypothetical protein